MSASGKRWLGSAMDGEAGALRSGGLFAPAFHFGRRSRRLYDLAKWENGLAFRDIHFTTRGLPVIKIGEVKSGLSPETKRTLGEYGEAARLRNGDLLFCWSGQPETSIGTYRWFGGDAWLNQHIFKVTPCDEVTFEYLYALLRFLQPNFIEIARNKQTTGLGHVTKADLHDMVVELPTTSEQRRIASIITSLDDKIELNRRMAETLEAMARVLFESWFVDFDPVHAKADGRPTGLPQDLATLFPDSVGEDGLPVNWCSSNLGEIADLNPESWTRNNKPHLIEYLDLSNTKFGIIEETRTFNFEDAPSRAQRVLRLGDTIVGTVRPGNNSYAYVLRDGLTGSTGFAVLRPQRPAYAGLVYLCATASTNIEAMAQLADGAAYPAVRAEVVARTPIALPDNDRLLGAFSRTVDPLLSRRNLALANNEALRAARDALLPKLISGELRIPDVDRQIAVA